MTILNISDVSAGKSYPPERAVPRVREMEGYYSLSNGDFRGLVPGSDYRLEVNTFRYLINFWVDALLSDFPIIEYIDNTRADDVINVIRPALMRATDDVVTDMVRYGVGVYVNTVPFTPQSVDPRFWFPVRMAFDDSLGDIDIIAYPYAENNTGVPDRILVSVYDRNSGNSTVAIHRYSGNSISEVLESSEVIAGAPAVIPVSTGSSLFGTSDYRNIIPYVAELHRRETAVSMALDKQANPHLSMPEGVMQLDAAGNAIVSIEGMVIPVPEGSSPPEYIVWDPSFEAQDNAIGRAEHRIWQLSGISQILVDPEITGTIPSGAALRRLAIQTVNKMRRIRATLTEAIRDVLAGNIDLIGRSGHEVVVIDRDKIVVRWPPELSGGMTDEADAISKLVEVGVLDRKTAIQMISKIRSSDISDEPLAEVDDE